MAQTTTKTAQKPCAKVTDNGSKNLAISTSNAKVELLFARTNSDPKVNVQLACQSIKDVSTWLWRKHGSNEMESIWQLDEIVFLLNQVNWFLMKDDAGNIEEDVAF